MPEILTERRSPVRERPNAAETHWSYYDDQTKALCGARISLKEFSREPSCPICRERLEAMA